MDGPPLTIGRRLRLNAEERMMVKMPIAVLGIDTATGRQVSLIET